MGLRWITLPMYVVSFDVKLNVSKSSDSNPFSRNIYMALSRCKHKVAVFSISVLFLALSFSSDYYGAYCLIILL